MSANDKRIKSSFGDAIASGSKAASTSSRADNRTKFQNASSSKGSQDPTVSGPGDSEKNKDSLVYFLLLTNLLNRSLGDEATGTPPEKIDHDEFMLAVEQAFKDGDLDSVSPFIAEQLRELQNFLTGNYSSDADREARANHLRQRFADYLPTTGAHSILRTHLLNMIVKPESGGNYNIAYGGRTPKTADGRTLDEMSLNEVRAHQRRMGHPSTAVGRYQIISSTMDSLIKEMGLTGNEIFDEAMQDRMGIHLLKRRGLDDFLAGRITTQQFMKNLSQEWAGLPMDMSGRSYYHGDGLNRAGISPQEVLNSLVRTKQAMANQPSGFFAGEMHPQPNPAN
jgi:muramidase (phage lysozyme)